MCERRNTCAVPCRYMRRAARREREKDRERRGAEAVASSPDDRSLEESLSVTRRRLKFCDVRARARQRERRRVRLFRADISSPRCRLLVSGVQCRAFSAMRPLDTTCRRWLLPFSTTAWIPTTAVPAARNANYSSDERSRARARDPFVIPRVSFSFLFSLFSFFSFLFT